MQKINDWKQIDSLVLIQQRFRFVSLPALHFVETMPHVSIKGEKKASFFQIGVIDKRVESSFSGGIEIASVSRYVIKHD